MGYIDDMEKNLKNAEKHLDKAEYAYSQGWTTAYYATIDAAEAIIKCVRFCVSCGKRGQIKHGDKFKCAGCMPPGSFERFKKANKGIWYILHWTECNNLRYKKR